MCTCSCSDVTGWRGRRFVAEQAASAAAACCQAAAHNSQRLGECAVAKVFAQWLMCLAIPCTHSPLSHLLAVAGTVTAICKGNIVAAESLWFVAGRCTDGPPRQARGGALATAVAMMLLLLLPPPNSPLPGTRLQPQRCPGSRKQRGCRQWYPHLRVGQHLHHLASSRVRVGRRAACQQHSQDSSDCGLRWQCIGQQLRQCVPRKSVRRHGRP